MPADISGLFRYPIKGLSCEPLTSVALQPGRGVPGDRTFALALPANAFDEGNPVASHARKPWPPENGEKYIRNHAVQTAGALAWARPRK